MVTIDDAKLADSIRKGARTEEEEEALAVGLPPMCDVQHNAIYMYIWTAMV